MKIICLKGGIGNQIFEYCRYLKVKESGEKVYIYYDSRRLKQHQNTLISDVFHITLPKEPLWITLFVWILKLLRVFKVYNKLYNDEEESAILIDDYSQSIEYTKLANDIFTFHNHIKQNKYAEYYMKKIEKSTYSVALHVRRGDYLLKENKDNFGVCSLAYYQKAKQYIASQYPNATFFVFSDDIEWCKNNLQGENTILVDIPQQAPDSISLYLMTQCTGHIIANSTFSFWGAKILTKTNSINIYPSKWFSNPTWNIPNYLPENWIKL